jgi:hypothetical protein
MRKSILAGAAALGFLAIALAVTAPALTRQADSEGSGADVRANRHMVVAMAGRSTAPTCVEVGTC